MRSHSYRSKVASAKDVPVPLGPPSTVEMAGLPPGPALEPNLTVTLRNRLAWHVGRRLVPLLPTDQIAARLTDRFHQCATQAAAATNSIFFLAYAVLRRLEN
ncbi:hypothetical protein GOODEAATRI_018706 [Goodea atripinnis]|uniref:Uncharacterized protein n=1 Tax=Goodea atripinnis TaxID=208336 RepID=A0ABV0MTZ3_9TELE